MSEAMDDLAAAASVLAMEVDSDAQDDMEQEVDAGEHGGDLLESGTQHSAARPTRRTTPVFLTLERLGLPVNRYLPTIQTCSQPHLTYPTLAATFP